MRSFLILAGLLLAAGLASAQFRQQRWVNGQCVPVGAPAQVQYEWRTAAGDDDHLYLYANGVQIGGWSHAHRVYMPFDARTQTWGAAQDCAPVGVPVQTKAGDGRGAIPKEMPKKVGCACGCKCDKGCACDDGYACKEKCGCEHDQPQFEQVQFMPKEMLPGEVLADGQSNFGIDLKKMKEECPDCHCNDCKCDGGKDSCQCHYTFRDHRGCPISREKAFQALANGVPDDRDFLRVTFVGPADQAAAVQKLLAATNWSEKVCFQTYASCDDAMLRDTATGQPLGCAPGLMVQSPAGLPLWYAASLPAADVLNSGLLLADARRKDPNWDPAKWPNLNIDIKPTPPAAPAPAAAPGMGEKAFGWCQSNWYYLAGAGAAAYFLRRRKS